MPRRITTAVFAYGKKGQYDTTISDFTDAIRINPKFAEAYNDRGKAYFMGRRNTTRPLPITRRASASSPNLLKYIMAVVARVWEEGRKATRQLPTTPRGHPAEPRICRGVQQPWSYLRENRARTRKRRKISSRRRNSATSGSSKDGKTARVQAKSEFLSRRTASWT